MTMSSQTPDILGDRQYGQDVRTQNGTLSLRVFIFRSCTETVLICLASFWWTQWWPVKLLQTLSNPHLAPLASTRYSIPFSLYKNTRTYQRYLYTHEMLCVYEVSVQLLLFYLLWNGGSLPLCSLSRGFVCAKLSLFKNKIKNFKLSCLVYFTT